MPLHYALEISNGLSAALTVTLAPGAGAVLAGPSSFTVGGGAVKSAELTIAAFTPGRIVDIEAATADGSHVLRDAVSTVDSAVAVRMHGLENIDETATLLRNRENTGVTVRIDAKPPSVPARRASDGTTYSVTLANDLPSEPLDVTVETSAHSQLLGAPSFTLAPGTQETLSVTDAGSFSAKDLLAIIDAATGQVKAKLELIKEGGNVGIGDMFQMQMVMNHLTQLSEMSASLVSASNAALASMARNVKS